MTRQELTQCFQRKQQELRQCWRTKNYEQGVQVLEELRRVHGMMDVDEFRAKILYDLACGYSLIGQKERAISFLREAVDTGLVGAVDMQYDRDLDFIRDEPGYKEIASCLSAALAFWDGPAFSTPYKKNISTDEKIAGLSKLWAEVRYNFAYFDKVPEIDWDALYLSYLPKVRKTKSTLEYYRLLQESLAKLKDGHTRIHFPPQLHELVYWRPCVITELIEDKVLVTEVYDEAVVKDGVRPGLEVIAVEGIPVHEYADQDVKPYQCASTKQALDRCTYWAYLLSGPKDCPVTVTLADEHGKTFDRALPRNTVGWIKMTSSLESQMLDDNISYVAVNTMGDNQVPDQFDSLFPSIEQADALIIDVRRNGGGSSHIGLSILGYLTDKPFKTERVKTRNYLPFKRAHGLAPGWLSLNDSDDGFLSNGNRHFTKSVVVLIGPDTCSAAEDFCVAFDAMKRGKMIGAPTSGSTGQPLFIALPGEGGAQICTPRSTYPDGKEFVGIGVQPDILVIPTIADVRAGRDVVLEAALDYLQTAAQKLDIGG